jgi:hypothetical protein
VTSDCTLFRHRLSSLLSGAPNSSALVELGWHAHLLGCDACRDLLAKEEALEHILSSLPEPKLPPSLAARVLARLAEMCGGLDSLLELDQPADAPLNLASSVLRGVRASLAAEEGDEQQEHSSRADYALDRLLDRNTEVALPTGLSERVLQSVTNKQDEALDRLLDRDNEVALPTGLSERVLQGVTANQDLALERLLERAGTVDVPAGLTAFVLEACEVERRITSKPSPVLAGPWRSRLMSMAAGLLVILGGYSLWSLTSTGESTTETNFVADANSTDAGDTGTEDTYLASGATDGLTASSTEQPEPNAEVPDDEFLAMFEVLAYAKLPTEEPDAELDAFTNSDEATLAMLEFPATTAALFEDWKGFEEYEEEAR